VHNRDILSSFEGGAPSSRECFEWQKHFRYYWEPDDQIELTEQPDICIVRQLDARYSYAFEYEGVASRLVVTPLTERCCLVITQASRIQKGAALCGSAGTGKTETVKDIAKSLGALCVEFNCNDQVTPQLSGQILAGLAQQGCWACLDEFNCIEVEVLSVIAQQLSKVQQALRMGRDHLQFEEAIMPLKHSIHICVTMNPRTNHDHLPDSLMILLRPVSMALPNSASISEVILFSEGFVEAAALSEKVTAICRFAAELLSDKHHYDFGLRTLKIVLARAGELRRKSARVEKGEPLTPMQEGSVVVQALSEAHAPGFTGSDAQLFGELLHDSFPGLREPGLLDRDLMHKVKSACKRLRLKPFDLLLTKACEIHVAQQTRMGVMLLGPPGGGKSTVLDALAETIASKLHRDSPDACRSVEVKRVNPKTLAMVELFGSMSELTGEWVQGLVARLLQPISLQRSGDEPLSMQWVIFDGPIDPIWIENLHAVLDDNRTLCLANSERIRIADDLHIFFRVVRCRQRFAIHYFPLCSSVPSGNGKGWFGGLLARLSRRVAAVVAT
jgi:dynein heavy chain